MNLWPETGDNRTDEYVEMDGKTVQRDSLDKETESENALLVENADVQTPLCG